MYTKKKNDEDYLMHYGVKGMKWGVRRNRQSRAQRDARKLANTATKYYDASNNINALQDGGGNLYKRDFDNLNKYHKKTQRLVNKLQKKYGSVSAIPEFDKNGYVVKSVETSITKLDRQGRIKSVSKSSNPVETYDYRFGGSKRRENYVKKRNQLIREYRNKIKNAKTDSERQLLELELEEKEDRLAGID